MKYANGDLKKAAASVKAFPLTALGSLGFDYAQVTKGGVRLEEVDENLQSRFVDGCCGECEYFRQCVEMFGICTNTKNIKRN